MGWPKGRKRKATTDPALPAGDTPGAAASPDGTLPGSAEGVVAEDSARAVGEAPAVVVGVGDASSSSSVPCHPSAAASSEDGRRTLVWRRPSGLAEVPSICALCQGLGPSDGAKEDVTIPDLLLALAHAHDRWTLDAPVAAVLRDLLRPTSSLADVELGLQPHQEDGYRWLMARARARLGAILADDMGLGKTRQAVAWLLGIRARLLAASAARRADAEPGGSPASGSPAQGLRAAGGDLAGCGVPGCTRHRCRLLEWQRALVLAPGMLVKGEDSIWLRELREAAKASQAQLRTWQWAGVRAQELRSHACTAEWEGPLVELFDVVVTTYESFLQNQDMFCQESWTCVILDEAQRIKNSGAKTAAAVKRLASVPFRLAITGTPIENSLEDVHSILQFAEPDCAGSLREFWQRFPDDEEGRGNLKRFLQSVALRRTGGDTVKMVPKEEVEVAVSMTELQRRLYDGLMALPGLSAFKRFKDLELLCSHPWCYAKQSGGASQAAVTTAVGEGPAAALAQGVQEMLSAFPERCLGEAKDQAIGDSGKMQELFGILRALLCRGQKVLVFFCRTVTGRLLQALVQREFGFRPGLIDGDVDLVERERSLSSFQAERQPGVPHIQVMLLSVWVGACGLNLPEARWVVHFERVWNPALERQATSRVHRLTSKLPIKAYGLYTEASVEERKRLVLREKSRLSSHIVEALDGDLLGEDGQEEPVAAADCETAAAAALRSSSSESLTSGEGDAPDDDPLLIEGQDDSEEEIPEEEPAEGGIPSVVNCGLYPVAETLRPETLRSPLVGKYGDPCSDDLWAWYTGDGRSDVHPRAHERTTGHLYEQPLMRTVMTKFASRQVHVRDHAEREDTVVNVELRGADVKLFIPASQRRHFDFEAGRLRWRPPTEGEAPFPLLCPSSGRSALDAEAGLLDLTGTMIDGNGRRLAHALIVAVRPSEVENYRASAPFFTVMELPRNKTMEHPRYGPRAPEHLGVGCARHWLLKLADELNVDVAFMLDDSVMAWRGITLKDDAHCLFGRKAEKKAQFIATPLARVLEHFADPGFLKEGMSKLSLVGFARYRPELVRCRLAYMRGHVYAAFLVNVKRVVQVQNVNFGQHVFIWEDLLFNIQARDVCKCFRFAMVKKKFATGGCVAQIARSATPFLKCVAPQKLSANAVAAETLGEAAPVRGRGRGSGRGGRGGDRAPEQLALVVARDALDIERDKEFTAEGAITDVDGNLQNLFYKAFIQAFKDKEIALMDPAAPTGFLCMPGMREGEEKPFGLRHWDDTRRHARQRLALRGRGRGSGAVGSDEAPLAATKWGAGWIATVGPKKSRWFNIRVWGSWRLAFVLAKLQLAVWEAKGYAAHTPKAPVLSLTDGSVIGDERPASNKRRRASTAEAPDEGKAQRERKRRKEEKKAKKQKKDKQEKKDKKEKKEEKDKKAGKLVKHRREKKEGCHGEVAVSGGVSVAQMLGVGAQNVGVDEAPRQRRCPRGPQKEASEHQQPKPPQSAQPTGSQPRRQLASPKLQQQQQLQLQRPLQRKDQQPPKAALPAGDGVLTLGVRAAQVADVAEEID